MWREKVHFDDYALPERVELVRGLLDSFPDRVQYLQPLEIILYRSRHFNVRTIMGQFRVVKGRYQVGLFPSFFEKDSVQQREALFHELMHYELTCRFEYLANLKDVTAYGKEMDAMASFMLGEVFAWYETLRRLPNSDTSYPQLFTKAKNWQPGELRDTLAQSSRPYETLRQIVYVSIVNCLIALLRNEHIRDIHPPDTIHSDEYAKLLYRLHDDLAASLKPDFSEEEIVALHGSLRRTFAELSDQLQLQQLRPHR